MTRIDFDEWQIAIIRPKTAVAPATTGPQTIGRVSAGARKVLIFGAAEAQKNLNGWFSSSYVTGCKSSIYEITIGQNPGNPSKYRASRGSAKSAHSSKKSLFAPQFRRCGVGSVSVFSVKVGAECGANRGQMWGAWGPCGGRSWGPLVGTYMCTSWGPLMGSIHGVCMGSICGVHGVHVGAVHGVRSWVLWWGALVGC